MSKTALITGIAGQDGSYLAELLLAQRYRVHGIVRSLDPARLARIAHLREQVTLHRADLLDAANIRDTIERAAPDEIYNLAARSFVPDSFTDPLTTVEATATSVARLLEAVRLVGRDHIRFYQASSSEMFGVPRESPQRETTPFLPRSPYGVAKVFGHYYTISYRECYGIYAVSGILYNHESPRRGTEFVTRKITSAVARIERGELDHLELGNLAACRDWGFAGDYVRAMWRMLQQDQPRDYVIGTGRPHSVMEFARTAFAHAGLDAERYLRSNPALVRPVDSMHLVADASKARQELDWTPEVDFESLVRMMVDADRKALAQCQR